GLLVGGRQRPVFVQVDGKHVGVGDDGLQMRFDGSREPLRSGAGAGRDGADALGVLGDGTAVNGDEQIFLGGDVVVEAGLAQPHAVGDVLHGGGVVALLPKQ